ncbi:copper chaperone PCu(A)C [Candidatus Rhodobacter oscarellae]|nr:copper chaperone PCu(A)C [Candidatus Rhodobacter lobularis]
MLRFLPLCLALIAHPALADVAIHDAYARVAHPKAKAGAVFLQLENSGDAADRLLAVESPAAMRVELHTHSMVDGAMLMREVEGGFEIPAGGAHALERGGDHIMFMGLTAPWKQGEMIPVTLRFESGQVIETEIEVDLERKPDAHSGH